MLEVPYSTSLFAPVPQVAACPRVELRGINPLADPGKVCRQHIGSTLMVYPTFLCVLTSLLPPVPSMGLTQHGFLGWGWGGGEGGVIAIAARPCSLSCACFSCAWKHLDAEGTAHPDQQMLAQEGICLTQIIVTICKHPECP